MQNPVAETIEPLLHKMADLGASDLHLKTGVPPMYRIGGELRRTNLPVIEVNSRQIERLMDPLIPAVRRHIWEEKGGLDFAHNLPNGDRFRINIYRACDQMHAAIRRVKGQIPSFEELHMPPIYKKLAEQSIEGIIIVCGVTGCGKSTTQAAMIDYINATQAVNIISIEDPIEYSFTPKKAIEIGRASCRERV